MTTASSSAGEPGMIDGPEAWSQGMHLEIPETKTLANPYTYADSARWEERDDAGSR